MGGSESASGGSGNAEGGVGPQAMGGGEGHAGAPDVGGAGAQLGGAGAQLGGAGGAPSPAGGEAGAAGAPPLVGCGAVERCEPEFLGTDDDCNAMVDEGCSCTPGQAHACFKGDAQYRDSPGCFDGTEVCTDGVFGACQGGLHAISPDDCYVDNPQACQPLTALPFASVDLSQGVGEFGSGADPGSESWSVDCPSSWATCPAVQGAPARDFLPLLSGEYSVTYTRSVNQVEASCTYPLFVKATGLRVELSWETASSGGGADLDLYLHRPQTTSAWTGSAVCNWQNCLVDEFDLNPDAVSWFDSLATPPDPVNWYLYPTQADNSCYFAPRGAGLTWQGIGLGCHSPRLDLDRVSCDADTTDPETSSFCVPENANIDFPPLDKWTRIGVHYYSANSETRALHPRVRIFCGGSLAADLGPLGYYEPSAPVTFTTQDEDRFWQVADVRFGAGLEGCEVAPLYASAPNRTPVFSTKAASELTFGPAYPP